MKEIPIIQSVRLIEDGKIIGENTFFDTQCRQKVPSQIVGTQYNKLWMREMFVPIFTFEIDTDEFYVAKSSGDVFFILIADKYLGDKYSLVVLREGLTRKNSLAEGKTLEEIASLLVQRECKLYKFDSIADIARHIS